MTYRILYADTFTAAINQHVSWLVDEGAAQPIIERWYAALFRKIDGLRRMPRLYAVDRHYTRELSRETRKMSHRGYVVFYQVDEQAQAVRLIHFMHGSRRARA